jgi:hypothetical protein
MCAEALLRIVLAYRLSIDTMVVISNVLPYVVLAGLITWTITYGKRQARAAQGRVAAAQAAA